ncbi:GGDEF domain-containing protein [Rhodoferax sp. GW822-FHT02A01]|uniref:GGDEF domain-containing protein n=1 Tax=Rhodoferax sp. GW822-FHT02A01 TaxID=3141537 RepID=UPI00315D2C7A
MARCQRTGSRMALMYLDIDHFKSINDTYGHGVGDLVLCEVANRLKSSIRVTDTAARLAGDEFVLILEDLSDQDEVQMIAEKLVGTIRATMQLGDHKIHATTSIGITLCEGNELNPAALVARADRALYQAKAAGRDTFWLDVPPGT